LSIGISVVAATFTGLQWYEARETRRQQFDAVLELESDMELDQNRAGISLRNVGPGVARVRSVSYYMDGKLLGDDPSAALDQAKLDPNRNMGTTLDQDEPIGPSETIPLVLIRIKSDEERDRAVKLFEDQLQVRVEYRAVDGKRRSVCTPLKCPAKGAP